MPKQTCLIHIGPQKTGSSAIQRWFKDNAGNLEEDGVLYSEVLGPVSHRHFVSLFSEYDPGSAFTVDTGSRSAEQFAAWKKEKTREAEEEIRAFRDSGHRFFVISHENLSRLSPQAVREIGDWIKPLFDEVTVIGFLRPDAELACSWLSTHARNGRTLTTDFLDTYKSNNLHMIKAWSGIFHSELWFPSKRIGSIAEVFTNILELGGDRYGPGHRTNEGLDFRTVVMLADLKLPLFVDGKRNLNRRTYVEDIPVEVPVQISRAHADAIQKRHRAANKEIAALCEGIDLSDLTADLNDFPEAGNFLDYEEPIYLDLLRHVIGRLNVQINLEKGRSSLLLAELHIERGRDSAAAKALQRAERHLDAAQSGRLDGPKPELLHLQKRLKQLSGKLERRPAARRRRNPAQETAP